MTYCDETNAEAWDFVRIFTLILVFSLVLAFYWAANSNRADTPDGADKADKMWTGIFSNKAEGFGIITVMLHADGLAYFHAAVGGLIGECEFDKASSILSIKVFDPASSQENTFQLKFDEKTRSYQFANSGDGEPEESSNRLTFVQDELPEKVLTAFKAYPGKIKEFKAHVAKEREWEKGNEARLERERPEYERILSQIRQNPKCVLSGDYYSGETTPTTRAFFTSLTDKDTQFPDEVLAALLELLPEENPWIQGLIFSRIELEAATLTKYYPKALKWGQINFYILEAIAKHPNTPVEILRDIAGRKELPSMATSPAQERLKKLDRDQKSQ